MFVKEMFDITTKSGVFWCVLFCFILFVFVCLFVCLF